MSFVQDIQQSLRDLVISEKAAFLPIFFKTEKGEYGEGDIFLGVTVPDQRVIAKKFYSKISLKELSELISSSIHEERLTALFILVIKYEKTKIASEKVEIVDFYLNNLQFVNNWDLVDSSCYKILGRHAFENKQDDLLKKLSNSNEMWHKRIAVVGTMYYVKKNQFELTKELVTDNLHHHHDLMHKANGWLLREIGGKNEGELISFLNTHYKVMPRTSLRYAIEKLDEDLRQDYLKGRI